MKTQSRFSNGGLILSLITLAILLLTQIGLGDIIPLEVDIFAVGVIGILSFLGIVSNPKDGTWYWSKNTSWAVRLRDYRMWVGIAALLAALVAQVLKWLNLMPLPFDLFVCLMTFLSILQAAGIVNGQVLTVTESTKAGV